MPPGSDRLVMNRNCEIISVLTNGAGGNAPPIISACQSQVSSLTPPSSPASSPPRAPASIPPQQPALSPNRDRLNRIPTLSDGVAP